MGEILVMLFGDIGRRNSGGFIVSILFGERGFDGFGCGGGWGWGWGWGCGKGKNIDDEFLLGVGVISKIILVKKGWWCIKVDNNVK